MADHLFRLLNTPRGTLLVKFYQVDPCTPDAFQRRIIVDFLIATTPGRRAGDWFPLLFQGLVDDVPILAEAVWRLAAKCPDCNCVRIEQVH